MIDVLTGTAGDDTFIGDAATVTAADQIDGGAGTDTLKMFGTLTVPQATNVENVYFNGITGTVNLSATSFTSVEFDNAATTHATAVDTITISASQSLTFDSITDGDATDEAGDDSGNIVVAAAAAVTAHSITFDGVGGKGAGEDLEIDVAGTGVTTLNLTSIGTANYVGLLNAGSALKTVNVSGGVLFDADENALTTVTTIDASATTGGVLFNTTGGTQDLTFKGGSGNDTLIIGAGLDADDKLSFGEGTDTLILTSADLTSATNVQVKAINAATGLERVLSNTAAGDGVAIDFSKFTTVNALGAVANTPDANATTTDGDTALTITGLTAADTILVGGNLVGGTGGAASDAAGGDAISISTAVNGGNDTANLLFIAAANVTGGASKSADDTNTTIHAAGDGLAADTVENIFITTADKDADVVFAGGSNAEDATNDTAGASVTVGANAKITISGAGDVNLGTVVSAAGTSADDLTINGADMTGILTVTTGAGNDTITGGSKADVINAGTGTNTITTGAGVDKVVVADGASSLTAMTSITDFSAGAGGDTLNFTGTTLVTLSAAAKAAIAADTTLADAVAEATGTGGADGANEIVGFTFGGVNYIVFNHAATAGFSTGDGDNIINIGSTDYTTLHADNFV